MPSLIQRLRDSAAHYRRFMFPEVFPGLSVPRHVALLEEAADELDGKGKFDSIAWQGCLDHANKNAAAARADADRVRNQLFEAREQRDEARESSAANGAEAERAREYAVKTRLETVRALTERDEARADARNAWAELCKGPIGWTCEDINRLQGELRDALARPTADSLSKAVARLLIEHALTQVGEGRGWHDHDAALKAVREQLK